MDITTARAPRSVAARRLLLTVFALCLVLAATPLAVSAYDPTRPVNDRDGAPGSGGGGGGGGTSGRKLALGVATPDGRSMAELDSFTASTDGRRPAIWVIWSQWGHTTTRTFPTATVQALRDRGVTPMIWWEPIKPSEPNSEQYARHANINAGTHDEYIRQFARDAKAFGGTLLLRFAQEVNGNYFPWSINSFDNSPESFIAAWRRIHGIFMAEGATNVRFVWSVAKESCLGGCNPYQRVYPGDAYVDVMGFSGYNWGAEKQWVSMYECYERPANLLAQISGKPVMVAETGSNSEGGDKAAWIRDGYPEVYQRLPQIKAIVYLNADLRDAGHPDWRIASPAAALDAYAEVASMTEFTGASPFSGRQDTKARADRVRRDGGKERAAAKADRRSGSDDGDDPKVRKGTAVDESPSGPQAKPGGAVNRTTKRRTEDPDASPPAVQDTFSR